MSLTRSCWIISVILGLISCQAKGPLEEMGTNRINELLNYVKESDSVYKDKEISFDSVLTYVGRRTFEGAQQNIKLKLFYYGNHARGYYNIPEVDQKNLQVFGISQDGYWIFKCVSQLDSEEIGSYLILNHSLEGIWSGGHINYVKETIKLNKTVGDYHELQQW